MGSRVFTFTGRCFCLLNVTLTLSWENATEEPEICNSDSQNPIPCGVHVDLSGLLLRATVSTFATSVDADVSSMPLGDTGFQNSLYCSEQDSSELLNSAGQVDSPTPSQIFVKVYKSGSVGCSLDISQFSSYMSCKRSSRRCLELRESLKTLLDQASSLYVLTGKTMCFSLETTHGSRAFLNNFWYIKIISPEGVHKMREQAVESFSLQGGQRMNSGSGEAQDLVSGLPSLGMLEY